ncbi:MAG: UDP-glucose 4-epimerase GalE [Pseudomonadota bacterium]
MKHNVLVTGGAGYIGSHVARQLHEAGHDVTVFDNLSTGYKDAVIGAKLVEGDLSSDKIEKLLAQEKFHAILHFAASIIVPESVENPLKYYSNNTANSLRLLSLCQSYGVKRFIFSSTAAVYGIPPEGVATEETPTNPINPYGQSKLMTEKILIDHSKISDFRFVALRYFNVAGSDPELRQGLRNPKSTLLIKVCVQAALGKRNKVTLYGTDYPTHDGTCIRDYIHVEDLAAAHLNALNYLDTGGTSQILNCGYGHGSTVREVLAMVEKVSGKKLTVEEAERRAGDPPTLISKAEKIRHSLGWKPKYDDLELIVRNAYDWEKTLK